MMEKDNLRSEECGNFLESLSAYLDGELTAEDTEKIRSHIDNCAECRAVYERFAALSADIKSIEAEIPEELHGSIMDAVKCAGKKKGTLQGKLRRYGLWIGAGVAAVLCLVLIGSPIFEGGMSMDLAKSVNDSLYAAEEDKNYAAYNDSAANGVFDKSEAAEDIGNIDMSLTTEYRYYSTYAVQTPTEAAADDGADFDNESDTDKETFAVEPGLERAEESGLKSMICSMDSAEETETEKPVEFSVPNFFPERGRLTPVK